MNQWLISIIIPTYNRLEYFKVALNSAMNQTYENIEIIITDDSTNDNIQSYLKSIDDTRIKYFKNHTNLGIALNTKNGILLSKGAFFAFLNDDDFWNENFLFSLVEQIDKYNNVSCAFSDHWLVDSNGKKLVAESNINTNFYKRNFLKTGIISQINNIDLFINFTIPVAMACLINREEIDINNYPSEVGGAYDRWLLLQLVSKKNANFVYSSERLTNYRVHSLSVSNTQNLKVAKSVLFILLKSKSILKLNKVQLNQLNVQIRAYIHQFIKNLNAKSFNYIVDYIKTIF